ncbi:hypothetical protein [Tuberibacillus sp. Marseille-P3662]|uniref:Dph6-related ATP pyrophosphatase n=1 Tax=Tuberibacillus sp. Marseille-P3662 TaxID=1965358 RepID=UPI000A1C8FBB|nr:hypothetical protein [Tuberibacillus sp. Marseille-P3662]
MDQVAVSWSGGKDCTWALHELLHQQNIHVVKLLTTISGKTGRVPMHEISLNLIQKQAESMGVPIDCIQLPDQADNAAYNAALRRTFQDYKKDGMNAIVYADLNIASIREFREQLHASSSIQPLFPLWQKPTDVIAKDFINSGYQAIITCVDTNYLSTNWLGCPYNSTTLASLPEGVDLCGENGEFHTFVYDGPIFEQAVALTIKDRMSTFNGRFRQLWLDG